MKEVNAAQDLRLSTPQLLPFPVVSTIVIEWGKDLPSSPIRSGISNGPRNTTCQKPLEMHDLNRDDVGVFGVEVKG